MQFTELQQFGWNWLTASFVVVSLITLWQYRTNFLQAYGVWKKRSATSLSVSMATSMAFICGATLWYGLEVEKLTIVSGGGLVVFALPIMIGAWCFGNPKTADYVVLAVCASWSLLAFTSLDPAIVAGGFALGFVVPLLLQVRELYKTKERGVLSGEWLLSLVVKNVFLNVFALASGDILYSFFSPIYLFISVWHLALWWHYGKPRPQATSAIGP